MVWFREKFGPGSFSRRLAGEVDQFTAKYSLNTPIPFLVPIHVLILLFIFILLLLLLFDVTPSLTPSGGVSYFPCQACRASFPI